MHTGNTNERNWVCESRSALEEMNDASGLWNKRSEATVV